MTDLVVRAENMSRVYPGPPPTVALQQCTLTIERGEHVAITGPSGSGKSTLLALLGLLDRPTSGGYWLDGMDTSALSDREQARVRAMRIGFVFQAFHLIPYRTVAENIELGLLYQGVGRGPRRARVTQAVRQVGLTERACVPCGVLSGGERQRVAIARALVRRPAMILCDEPTGNLDSQNAAHVLDLIDDLHDCGITAIVITHDVEVAKRADRRIALRDGLMSRDGS